MVKNKIWYFVNHYTGEELLIKSPWSRCARAIAQKYFDFPICIGVIEPQVAATMKIDIY